MEMIEQFKTTNKYKKWKEEKNKQIDKLSRRKGRSKAIEESV